VVKVRVQASNIAIIKPGKREFYKNGQEFECEPELASELGTSVKILSDSAQPEPEEPKGTKRRLL